MSMYTRRKVEGTQSDDLWSEGKTRFQQSSGGSTVASTESWSDEDEVERRNLLLATVTNKTLSH